MLADRQRAMKFGQYHVIVAVVLVVFLMLLSVSSPGLFEPPTRAQRQKGTLKAASVVPTAASGGNEEQSTDRSPDDGTRDTPAPSRDPRCNGQNRREWRPAKCQDDNSWLLPWMKTRPQSNWTLVDVGANKGYVIAGWLYQLLGSSTQFNTHNLGIAMYKQNITGDIFKSACGGCCECVDPDPRTPDSIKAASVKVYGFEPSPANYRFLHSFFTDEALVNVTHAAVSDKDYVSYFPDNPLGVEIGKVRDTPAKGYVKVDVLTIDRYLSHLDFIDVFSTDAEGFDQDVARGAKGFLQQGRVGVYQFEMYRREDYKAVFERLQSWGYTCYFATESKSPRIRVTSVSVRNGVKKKKDNRYKVPQLVRITDCWVEEYREYTGWVNGLCHNNKVPHLTQIFNQLARTLHQGGNGNCPSRVLQRKVVLDFVSRYVTPAGGSAPTLSANETEKAEEEASGEPSTDSGGLPAGQ